MIKSGRTVALMVIGVVIAALAGASQDSAAPGKSAGEPAAPESVLLWAEVLEEKPDPKVVTDPELFKGIIETKLPWRVKDKGTGIEMLLVPPGKFVMGMSLGDAEGAGDERPAHEVMITSAFYLGRTEVTQAQWVQVMENNPSQFQHPIREALVAKYIEAGFTKRESLARAEADLGPNPELARPVEQVSWDDCQRFCAKTGMALPTEAQWEYACRAGLRRPRPGDLRQIAWYSENAHGSTAPVGLKLPNALGFYDMIGNVQEWCQDWLGWEYYESCEDGVVDPRGPAMGEFRSLRGGSWYDGSSDDRRFNLRSSSRAGCLPDSQSCFFGFRVSRNP